ncbi:MAG: hypothetical protein Q9213_000842 [Squamulea squamosa]
MEGEGSARQEEGNQMATSVAAIGLAKDETDQLTIPASRDRLGDGKGVHEEARGQGKVSVHGTDVQFPSGSSTETLTEANGPARYETDHPPNPTEPSSSEIEREKKVHKVEAFMHRHDKVLVEQLDVQLPGQGKTGDSTEAPSSSTDKKLHEQRSPVKTNGSVKDSDIAGFTPLRNTPALEICAHCLNFAGVKCVQCGSTWYCSRECQRIDWTYHKHLCRDFKELRERPEPGCVRAIFFPENAKTPKFVWIKQNKEPLDLGFVDEKFDLEELEELLEVTEEGITQQYVTRSIRRDRRADVTTARVYLLLHERSFTDGSKPNMSIGWITKGNFHFSWRGPMVAVLTRFDESEGNPDEPVVEDMSMVDFRDLIDFFGLYGQWLPGCDDFGAFSFWWMPEPLRDELQRQHQIQGVQVTGEVEHKHTGVKYQTFDIGEGHPAMAFLQPLPVTCSLGLPLLLRRKPADEAWKEEAEASGNLNFGQHMLYLDIDPKSRNWGRTGAHVEHGTVLLMRQDCKDLHPHHVETVIMYLIQVVDEAMKESIQGRREKGEVLELLHPSRLDWYFNKYRKQKAEKEESWKDVPPLFDLPTTLTETTRRLAGLGFGR